MKKLLFLVGTLFLLAPEGGTPQKSITNQIYTLYLPLKMAKYIALLRGINVGVHHKVPMVELKAKMLEWGSKNVTTLLNSGNIVFESDDSELKKVESALQSQLENHFGFVIPVICVNADEISDLVSDNPFEGVEINENIRLYLTFLRENPKVVKSSSEKGSEDGFKILETRGRVIISVLDLSISKTVKGMEKLEKLYGKNITTRNYNTILKLHTKLM